MANGYQTFPQVGLALDPVHVGTGGARLGRVDLTIVRDPVTRIPKIPGSSLAGVHRAYAAMAMQAQHPDRKVNGRAKPYYPDCAGLGERRADGSGGHCQQSNCPICTVFGFATGRDSGGGFAGLAAFSDAHLLLFPVASREGPRWVTCPMALRDAGVEVTEAVDDAIYQERDSQQPLNLGWLLLPVQQLSAWEDVRNKLNQRRIPDFILQSLGIVSNKLFGHVVNSNLEVRTSVSIDPTTGAAAEGLLFSYEALPRTTVLVWDVTCKNPQHFTIGSAVISLNNAGSATVDTVHEVTEQAHPYLEHLGIGGMGTRGMGRLRVFPSPSRHATESETNSGASAAQSSPAQGAS